MSTYFTTAPEAADYATVLSSEEIAARFAWTDRAPSYPFRRVVLDDREDGYYREYQLGRYRSFGVVVLDEAEWQREIDTGGIIIIILEEHDG